MQTIERDPDGGWEGAQSWLNGAAAEGFELVSTTVDATAPDKLPSTSRTTALCFVLRHTK